MSRIASVTEVARNFSRFIDRVAAGEGFVLTRGGKAVAELRPVAAGRRLSELPEIFAALPRLEGDDAESLSVEIETARAELNALPVGDPWDS